MRERMNASVSGAMNGKNITVNLSHSLDTAMYNLPLTLRTRVPASWKKASIRQAGKVQEVPVKDGSIVYQLTPNRGKAEISPK